MTLGATAQILIQPWREKRQTRGIWLVWLLLATAFLLPLFAFGMKGSGLATLAFVGPVTIFVALWWLMLTESAHKQLQVLTSSVVPSSRRKIIGTVLMTYVAVSLGIGALVALTVGQMSAAVEWSSFGTAVALTALLLATMALAFTSQLFAWAIVFFFIGGMQIEAVRRAVDDSFLFNSSHQFQSALMMLAAGVVGLTWAYHRPRQNKNRLTLEILRLDALEQQRPASFFYGWALQNAIRRKDFNALTAYATGAGAHWTIAVVTLPLLLTIYLLLFLQDNRYLWLMTSLMPLIQSSLFAEAIRQAAYATRAEQNLVLLVPHCPQGRELNRSLLAAYLKTFLGELLVVWAVTVPLLFFVGPTPYSKVLLASAGIVCSLPAVLRVVTDYSRMRPPSVASVIPGLLAGSLTLVALYLTHEHLSDLLPVIAGLVVAAVCILFVVRWRRALDAPRFFPAGRLASP